MNDATSIRPPRREEVDEIAAAWATLRALRHAVSSYPNDRHYQAALAEAEQEYARLKRKRVIR